MQQWDQSISWSAWLILSACPSSNWYRASLTYLSSRLWALCSHSLYFCRVPRWTLCVCLCVSVGWGYFLFVADMKTRWAGVSAALWTAIQRGSSQSPSGSHPGLLSPLDPNLTVRPLKRETRSNKVGQIDVIERIVFNMLSYHEMLLNLKLWALYPVVKCWYFKGLLIILMWYFLWKTSFHVIPGFFWGGAGSVWQMSWCIAETVGSRFDYQNVVSWYHRCQGQNITTVLSSLH